LSDGIRRFVSGLSSISIEWGRRFSLVSLTAFAYAGVMYVTAVVGGKVVRFKLSPGLVRAHRQNRGKALSETESVAFVEAKRRARALRRVRPYLASRP
jgi:hypothetical protein